MSPQRTCEKLRHVPTNTHGSTHTHARISCTLPGSSALHAYTVTLNLTTVSGGDFDIGDDFDPVWEAPNIPKGTFHAETALVAFDSQINNIHMYLCRFCMKYTFWDIWDFSYCAKVAPYVKVITTYGTHHTSVGCFLSRDGRIAECTVKQLDVERLFFSSNWPVYHSNF